METCPCGVEWKQFWLWRDGNGEPHASQFLPSVKAERTLLAASIRDALLSATNGRTPKHRVRDGEDKKLWWEGRCEVAAVSS